jgi:uncharacterized protein (UPF0332 family)
MLGRAETMLRTGLNEDAGRAAYLAGFHAAQALIFGHQDRVLKTHHGVQTKFSRLIKGDGRYGVEYHAFLGQTYNLKTIADYEIGPGSNVETGCKTNRMIITGSRRRRAGRSSSA